MYNLAAVRAAVSLMYGMSFAGVWGQGGVYPAAVTLEPWPVLMELGSTHVWGQVQALPWHPLVLVSQSLSVLPLTPESLGYSGTCSAPAFTPRTVLSQPLEPSSPAALSALFVLAFSVKRVTSVSFYVCICHQASCFQGPSTLEL